MALTWGTHFILPLPIGGAARLAASTVEAPESIRAILAPVAATDPEVVPDGGVSIDLAPNGPLGRKWFGVAWAAHGALQCAWFGKVNGAWEAGPVDAIALPFAFESRFEVPIDWIVDRLQDYALGCPPPLGDRPFAVSKTYPRNVSAWPMASVQLDSVESDGQVTGNVLESDDSGGVFQATYSITCWCETPEDRRIISPWLAGAMEALRVCCAYHPDLSEPGFSLSEAEDFQTLEVPAFLAVGRFHAKVVSSLLHPKPQTYGRVTVP